jgi:GNAT superfamily N-acetyltransferase
VRIEVARCADLPAAEWERLEEIAEREFGQYALVRETEWAQPDWCYRAFDGAELVVFHNIILRTVRVDAVDIRVAGLNNMITLPAFRGRGAASRLLRETQPRWFDELQAEIGLLLCADALVPFYSRVGWQRLDARVTYYQTAGPRTWPANCMVLDPKGLIGSPREVDLRGLPW